MKQSAYVHLSQLKRDRIQGLLESGHHISQIAHILEVHKSTISREIQRNRKKRRMTGGTREGPYLATLAHHKAYVRRHYAKYQGKNIHEDDALHRYITERLQSHWSPDEISGRMKKEKQLFYASKTAIYEWLYSSYGQWWCTYLYSQRYHPKKRRKKKTKRVLIPARRSIARRPLGAINRTRYGHYEGDTIVSAKKTASRAALSVLYERKAKYASLQKTPNLSPLSNNNALYDMRKDQKVLSMSFDNGIENTRHYELGIPTYFCDPYSSWQKGGVENLNKMIRWFIPKRSDLAQYSDSDILSIQTILNNKPRKSLHYQTPLEVMIKNKRFTQPLKNTRVALQG